MVKKGLKRENWDPRRCVSTRALPILWVTGCQLAQTAVNQDGQRNQNHLRGKSYSSETPAKFEVPSVSQTFCLLLLQPYRQAIISDSSLKSQWGQLISVLYSPQTICGPPLCQNIDSLNHLRLAQTFWSLRQNSISITDYFRLYIIHILSPDDQ